MNTAGPVLEIEDLKTFFYTREGVSRAVNGVGISLSRGEILGVVGESGCGKSLTALSILRLVPHPGRIVSGAIRLGGSNLLDLSEKQMRKIRGDRISMIFQEPMISLNPAFTIENQLVEAVQTHRQVTRADAVDRAIEMLKLVEIPAPERRIKDYPHQLSGGMRQRVMIAEALLLDPEVLLADEPTTALDVTIQAQILDIMYRLNQDTGTAIVLITHNLGLVAESANRVVVMYAGKVVEEGPAVAIFDCAGHPYTQGLLRSLPKPRRSLLGKKAPLYEMSGIVPSLFNLPTGCAFHPRCPSSKDICKQQEPPRFETEPGHFARCWLFERAD
jgi:oligopeptide/dipeptide ABC transporter ATP-binding protein